MDKSNLLTGNLSFKYYLSLIKPEGYIAYEYNPLRNFRITLDIDENGLRPSLEGFNPDKIAIEGGSIVDLDTELLNFSLNNPVDITIQKSYDGSDNLILNDNRNIPRLINSRFTTLPKNRYEIVDRIGNNDTNIYDDSLFDLDTSLYKTINYIPKITFNGVLNTGNLKVGNYTLYLKYADADGNETDFVAESSIISCFIGNDCDPFSIQGGMGNLNSNKSISIYVSNIDPAYDYIKVYYTRTTSDDKLSPIVQAYKINLNYSCTNLVSTIIITGDEDTTEIPSSEINTLYFIVDLVNTLALCLNMLFLGNVHKPTIDYADLLDISLRICPTLQETPSKDLIGNVDLDYYDNSISKNNYEYFNTYNIYNYVGYWNEEIYRLGVVYLLNDFTLSPVFNIRGTKELPRDVKEYGELPELYDEEGDRKYISVSESTFTIEGSDDNAKGVFLIPRPSSPGFKVNGIKINIPKGVLSYLQGRVKGMFFVRLKRIPTILCLTLVLPMDTESKLPLLAGTDLKWFIEGFLNEQGSLTQHYNERLKYVEVSPTLELFSGICPEYDLRPEYFNLLFTGTDYVFSGYSSNIIRNSDYDARRYIILEDNTLIPTNNTITGVKVIALEDNTPLVSINGTDFKGRAGEAEEAFRFSYIEEEREVKDNYKIVRGIFGPYLGIKSKTLKSLDIYNVRIPGYGAFNLTNYFNTRYNDNSPFYPISDRISLEDIKNDYTISSVTYDEGTSDSFYQLDCYRGDCYICTVTHRVNRNFLDPTAPINDKIILYSTWKDNYEIENKENLEKINRGDVNAVLLGSWITVKVLSTYNLNLRTLDSSIPSEEGLTGHPRGFFPILYCSAAGEFKVPESTMLNYGYGSSSGLKIYYTLPDVPYIKNRFDNRILYSDIAVNDSFKNGYRVFQFTHYRDYPRVYGGLIKLVELQGSLLAVWEHGVGIIPVNERAVAGEGAGGNVFINTSNVLPENPKMLSDMYGSLWEESVIKTPYYVYGVDTVGKKIWRTNGSLFEVISDFRILKFLNDNISLTERELEPIIGIRNVKTHYNAFKLDIMFTFYDNTVGFEERVWNICYNEVLQKWITFYSWIPSYSANIDNIYFSFDRNTSKWISKLGTSNKNSNSADGIVLDSPVIEEWEDYNGHKATNLNIVNRALPNSTNTGITTVLDFSLKRDNFGFYKNFKIEGNKLIYLGELKDGLVNIDSWKYPIMLLNIECNVLANYDPDTTNPDLKEYSKGWNEFISYNMDNYLSQIAVTSSIILNNSAKERLNLTTDFWKHGLSGIIDIKERIKPCFWYGKQHPFEFEFVVVDNPSLHKIFNNLQIISNKAKPESFHYEITGECFDFVLDKPNMYVRQEATKAFYQYNGSDILYNKDFLDVDTKQNRKSITMPLYYSRVDSFNEVEDYYKLITTPNKDYNNLSGTEIVRYDDLNEFRLWEHSKAVDIEEEGGRIRGNINYQEDKWDVLINPIIFVEKNENPWNSTDEFGKPVNPKVPITIGNSPIPEDFIGDKVTIDDIPEELRDRGYTLSDIDVSDWSIYPIGRDSEGNIIYADANTRKEIKVKDKVVKIRVRYSGSDLAIISALKTIYSISYA